MTDEEMEDLAKQVGSVKGVLGRLGTLYPGDAPSSFDPEEEMTEENESPSTDEEAEAFNRAQRKALNPKNLSEESQAVLLAEMGAVRFRALRNRALDAQ